MVHLDKLKTYMYIDFELHFSVIQRYVSILIPAYHHNFTKLTLTVTLRYDLDMYRHQTH